jgi:hypothetical protein
MHGKKIKNKLLREHAKNYVPFSPCPTSISLVCDFLPGYDLSDHKNIDVSSKN